MEKHVFVRNVIHSGKEFKHGADCPADLKEQMLKQGYVQPVAAEAKVEPAPKASAAK